MANVFITGVSSGIGYAIASTCVSRGHRVFGSVRNAEDAQRCITAWGTSFVPVVMDVRNKQEVTASVQLVKNRLNGQALDVLINNAGVAQAGPIALQETEVIQEMWEVNVLGVVHVLQALLPLMKSGTRDKHVKSKIINISSGAGKLSIPFLGMYVATKHALEGLSGSLRKELLPFGIDVVVVGPGNVITPIWEKAKLTVQHEGSPYQTPLTNFFNFMIAEAKKGMQPEEIALCIDKIIQSNKPKVRYAPVAQKFANWYVPRLLPERWVDAITFKLMGMKKIVAQ